jgi:selenocysteine-specific translation elongation factor
MCTGDVRVVCPGIQAQTAECLVVGEVTAARMVVLLNKADLLPEGARSKSLRKLQRRISQTLACTRFAGAPMIATSARPGVCINVQRCCLLSFIACCCTVVSEVICPGL